MTKTYLVTKDLVETLRNKYVLEIPDTLAIQVRGIENEFLKKFWETIDLPESVEKKTVDAQELARMLSEKLTGLLRCESKCNDYYISMDRIYLPEAPAFLEVTRITNRETGKYEIGPRAGCGPLNAQIASMGLDRGSKITLADVGAFSGGTLNKICFMFEQQGITISNICLGVANSAIATIEDSGIKDTLTVALWFDFYEWIELRKLLIDGRLVGVRNDGIREYIPYYLGDLEDWASIPADKVEETAELCKTYSERLICLLREYGTSEREIKERIGVPVKMTG